MARTARLKSESGYQHIIIRGIGKQILFEEDMDYKYFISLMRKYSEETKVRICAYCLMDNHVHLLIHDTEDTTITSFLPDIKALTALRRRRSISSLMAKSFSMYVSVVGR